MPRARTWFLRFTAVHFLVTSATGLVLYFRPGGGRPGWFSDETKEVLVMIHNGEWLSALLVGRPVYSGVAVGLALGVVLTRAAMRSLRSRAAGDDRSSDSAL